MDTSCDAPPSFKSPFEYRVRSTSNNVTSKIWFTTPPITQEVLDRLETIQLNTVLEEGTFNEDKEDSPQTWFELVIYRSWNPSEPRINIATKQELAWYCRQSRKAKSKSKWAEGPIFRRGDEMLKEIEADDVLAVRVCARGFAVNYATEGEIAVTFKHKSSPITPTTYTVYPYSSIGPCYAYSHDPTVVSKIWFATPPLDKNTIQHLSEVQLFTDSTDQGWASDRSGSYSWFELVILEPHSDTSLQQNNLELAWKSHDNPIGIDNDKILGGHVFQRQEADSLLHGLLDEGSRIGVRVCARFRGWKNIANEGRLELRFSEPVTQQKPIKSGKVAKAAKRNAELIKKLEKLYHEPGISLEISTIVLELMRELMKYDEDYDLNMHRLSILSLDGGGVRGLSSLLILQAVMSKVKGPNEEPVQPYECFDLIAGTSTGGLIAIMLGRLKMTVEQCIGRYERLAKDVFGRGAVEKYEGVQGVFQHGWDKAVSLMPDLSRKIVKVASGYYMYNAEELRKAIQGVVKDHDNQGPDAKMLDASDGCKVAVFACNANNVNNSPVKHFRTYWVRDDTSSNTKIWEAARATTAAPAYFDSIQIGEEEFVDGGLQVNNPVLTAVPEALIAFDKARTIGCLLSVGTGLPPDLALSKHEGITGGLRNFGNLLQALFAQATNSQLAHLAVEDLHNRGLLAEKYFRFNAKVDIPEQRDAKFSDKMISLDDVDSLEKFKEFTMKYLNTLEVQQQIQKCADQLQELYNEKKLQAEKKSQS
ncbi:hypothetical protein FRC12_015468 [Ceratobasidium sp. 428]|nr:hypothetical protein FRC12_015468 [Ceratobasidium sp. 428]